MKKFTAFMTAAVLLAANVNAFANSSSSGTALTQKGTAVTLDEKIADLQSLGIIDKSADMRLDDTITRAEVTKIICEAASHSVDGQYEEVYYTDVSVNHWAYPYITVATATGIIDGYDDGTFKPEEAVSVQELVKMLVCAVGYETYAASTGGYPHGYIMYGANLGITKDTMLVNDEKIKRGDAFELVYNTLDVPLLVIDGYEVTYDMVVPVLKVRDGEDFASLRTNKVE